MGLVGRSQVLLAVVPACDHPRFAFGLVVHGALPVAHHLPGNGFLVRCKRVAVVEHQLGATFGWHVLDAFQFACATSVPHGVRIVVVEVWIWNGRTGGGGGTER